MLLALQELLHAGKKQVTFYIPNKDAGLLNQLYRLATVEQVEYGAEVIEVTATVDSKTHGMLRRFDPTWEEQHEE